MKGLLLFLAVSLLLCGAASGEDISGPLGGIMGPGTYDVVGNLSVQQGDSLILLPGTIFLFQGDFNFTIFGYISFVGTEQDSVKLLKAPGSDPWNGLNCNPSTIVGSRLEYCVIDGSDMQGFETYACSFELSRCTIRNSSTQVC